jgi:hypothetical protein
MNRVIAAVVIEMLLMSSPANPQTVLAETPASSVVVDWNEIVMSAVGAETGVEQVRIAAIAHLAMFEAANAVVGGYEPYLKSTVRTPHASARAAAAAAAHGALARLVPEQKVQLDAELARTLKGIPEGHAKQMGVALGDEIAESMVRHRDDDGAEPPEVFVPSNSAPGQWQMTPSCQGKGGLFLHWRDLEPFGLARGNQFRGDAPPRLTSRRFARDVKEVRTVGAAESDERPRDREEVARFYALVQSQHVWNPVARQIALARDLSMSEAARLFALLNMAMNDALIAVMDAKYHYTLWRPETAIRAADTDGNPATEPDTSFAPFLVTPCHPSYPSAHASSSYAASEILERLHGQGRHAIELATPLLPGVELRYSRLEQITHDIDDARVFGGMHYRFDQQAGARQGRRVGQYVFAHHLRRARHHDWQKER